MNRKEMFIWAGLGVQLTTSHKAIYAMAIDMLPANQKS